MRIGEATAKSGVSERMIRHYEAIGLLPAPARRDSGYRDYDAAEIERLSFIRRCRELDFSLAEIADLIRLREDSGRTSAEVKRIAEAHLLKLDAKQRSIEEMRSALQRLTHACRGDAEPDCAIIAGLQADARPESER